jgi:hypothetical protein
VLPDRLLRHLSTPAAPSITFDRMILYQQSHMICRRLCVGVRPRVAVRVRVTVNVTKYTMPCRSAGRLPFPTQPTHPVPCGSHFASALTTGRC